MANDIKKRSAIKLYINKCIKVINKQVWKFNLISIYNFNLSIVDDGTAVMDCDCKHVKLPKPPPSPKKRQKPASSSSKPPSKAPSSPNKSTLSKYRALEKPKSKVSTNTNFTEGSVPLGSAFDTRVSLPPVEVGSIVRVQGRVVQGRGTRFLRVEPGDICVYLVPYWRNA